MSFTDPSKCSCDPWVSEDLHSGPLILQWSFGFKGALQCSFGFNRALQWSFGFKGALQCSPRVEGAFLKWANRALQKSTVEHFHDVR